MNASPAHAEVGDATLIVQVIDLLTQLYTPEGAAMFLRTPQPLLDNARPADLLGSDDGEARLIVALHTLVARGGK